MGCCEHFSPATCAGLDALSSLIGLVMMVVGLVNIEPDSSDYETAARALLITEIVLLTIQLFQSFVHYCAGISRSGPISVIWLLITIPLLLAHIIVIIVVLTVAGGVGTEYFAVAFGVSFILKIPQVFNMLRFVIQVVPVDYQQVN